MSQFVRASGRGGLIALNVALLAGLAVLTWGPFAGAQNAAQPAGRARGEYTMVAGKSNAGGAAVVYVIDSTNQELVALRWDQAKQQLIGVGYRNLGMDGTAIPGR